jgi:dihydrofolate synthase/folylpolyglutamate synthase
MPFASYSEACNWLFEQFPAYHNLGTQAYNPGLKNTEELLGFFENPQKELRFLHVAGTNGKGSVSAMLTSIFMESGEKVGCFSSPHIIDFSERIRINGKPVNEQFVVDFCNKVVSRNWTIAPSFFEMTWVMALEYFRINNCTLVVAEVGLGGRLDATNVIIPEISIITNISLDHTNILGSTRKEIAFEKGGIIKPNIPVVIGETDSETLPVFEKLAAERNSQLIKAALLKSFPGSIIGYQQINFSIVKTAIDVLNERGWSISNEQILLGIQNLGSNTGFFGRLQILNQTPFTLLDCAHNEAGIEALFQSIPKRNGILRIIYGTSSDKSVESIKTKLPHKAHYYFTTFENPRSKSIGALKDNFSDFHCENALFFSSVQEAFSTAQQAANKADTIVICGSFFLAHDFFSFFSAK